ncbi:hypothetical protein ACIO3S_17835 [Nocardioides sp. NPDC087217]|uniref:hypothetical protein n=1 Tax=Nocardioides sp. NPDC087217 TaxID=3364335 RepID=UPI00381E1A97
MKDPEPTSAANAAHTDAEELTAAAGKWIRRAARAWADKDPALVAVAAPMAVEQLGKAFLWRTNPLLVLPIDRKHEGLFIRMALNPSLADPSLRTIGLGAVLDRVMTIVPTWPLNADGAKSLADARNGAVHVGTRASASSEQLLRLAITACDRLLAEIGTSPEDFYGAADLPLVATLRKNYRTTVEELIGRRRARARHTFEKLRETAGEQSDEVVAAREATAADHLDGRLSDNGALLGVKEQCPVCGSAGRLYGRLDVDYEVDFDVEPMGGGRYDPIPFPYPVVTLSPLAFGCNVCQLRLDGADELKEGSINPEPRKVEPSDLPDDIDVYHLYIEHADEDALNDL